MIDYRSDRKLRTACLWVCTGLALTTLPADRFHAMWLVTFIAPAVVLHLLVDLTNLRPWVCMSGSLISFGVLLWVSTIIAPQLTRVTALGCTLVPPLAFLTARRHGLDVLRGLFLAFCLFLIGTILGQPSAWLCTAFLGSAIGTLYFDSIVGRSSGRHSWHGERMPPAAHARNLAAIVATALVACLAGFQLLRTLPAPSTDPSEDQQASQNRSDTANRVGLGSSFDLDGTSAGLLNLRSREILHVSAPGGNRPSRDLYLRFSHFDVAGLDRWRTRRGTLRRAGSKDWTLRRPIAGVPIHQLRITLLDSPSDHLLVPPGTVRIRSALQLSGDRQRDLYRLPDPAEPMTRYDIAYQDHRWQVEDSLTDPSYRGLVALSRDIVPWNSMFIEILRDAKVQREIDPIKIARAIANVVASRCSYSLKGPRGPHRHALLNFLDGDREGFCMHFASVTAICLRMAGVPCRIGVGLHGGDDVPDEPGVRSYGSRDAHAWVEIPFERVGWVVFDPTPPADLQAAREAWSLAEAGGALAGAEDDDDANGADDSSLGTAIELFAEPFRYPVVWIVLAVVLLASLFRRRETDATQEQRRESPETISARRLLEKLLRVLARGGWPRKRGTSLETYAMSLYEHGEMPHSELDLAFRAYQEVRFGGRPFDANRRDHLRRALAAIRKTDS